VFPQGTRRVALKFKQSHSKQYPNIHELISVFKIEQGETELVRKAMLGATLHPRRRKYRTIDQRLQRLRDQYQSGASSTDQFLDGFLLLSCSCNIAVCDISWNVFVPFILLLVSGKNGTVNMAQVVIEKLVKRHIFNILYGFVKI